MVFFNIIPLPGSIFRNEVSAVRTKQIVEWWLELYALSLESIRGRVPLCRTASYEWTRGRGWEIRLVWSSSWWSSTRL